MSHIELFKKRCDICGCKLKYSGEINRMALKTLDSNLQNKKDGVYYICDYCKAIIQAKLDHNE